LLIATPPRPGIGSRYQRRAGIAGFPARNNPALLVLDNSADQNAAPLSNRSGRFAAITVTFEDAKFDVVTPSPSFETFVECLEYSEELNQKLR
jgi:hypothetical protein